jgi:metallophosphoesterase (TIGR03767 family)
VTAQLEAAGLVTTARRRLVPGEAGAGGYRGLVAADGEQHVVREGLAGVGLPAGWRRSARPLLAIAQLSDTHVMDHQSPARAELLDRYSDPDSPIRAAVGIVGSYRAQELFTYQVAEAMVRAVRETRSAPLSGSPIDLAVVTGDATDNCQRNELRAYINLLDGGRVRPDSGDPERYEGVAGPGVEDERYWHPDGGGPDLPTSQYGFPKVPGVLGAVRRPFPATGLGLPWYAVHGNHDNMLQGMIPAAGWLRDFPVSSMKFVTPPTDIDPVTALRRFDGAQVDALLELASGARIAITPDPARAPVTRAEHVREHFRTSGRPAGHGYTRRNADEGTAYYAFDHGIVRCIILDTVNPHGGWQGSLDLGQLDWLVAELRECAARPVLLFSHHSLETMVNDRRPPGAGRRILGPELRDVLLAHPCVVGWVNGHTHVHAIRAVVEHGAPGGFWQVTTASHIDWPQQARIIELLETPSGLAIACTVIDSAAPASYLAAEDPADPAALAALARELAANDWQVRDKITADGGAGAGAAADRNAILPVDWPRPAPRG